MRPATTARSDTNLNTHAGTRQHLDQPVNTEEIDLAAYQVADPRLSHTEQLSSRRLSHFPSLYQPRDLHHQLCPQLQALGLLTAEPQITEHVPARPLNLVEGCDSRRVSVFRLFTLFSDWG